MSRFLGIDFGWEGKPSGLAALDWTGRSLHLAALTRCADSAEVLAWVDAHAGADAVVGVDAPLVIPNAAGMRDVDKLAHSHYGKYHAGAYPASRARAYWERTTGLSEALLAREFAHGDAMGPRAVGRYQIEVHPHAATVQLNRLDRIVKYKRGRLAERRAGLKRLRDLLLERLPRLTPPLLLRDLPEIPAGGAALKAVEDQLDAVTCAYVAAHWWFWARARNHLLGDASRGYMVVPRRTMPNLSMGELRETYTRAGLPESDAAADPVTQFESWFADARAAGLREPNAMTLATATREGVPSARIVLLKGLDERGFVFYTNYESRKGGELRDNPRAALVFHWVELERQVRVTGDVMQVSRQESEAYFHTRPAGSQFGAWASRQSSVIVGRAELERSLADIEARYGEEPIPLPPFWGGFRVRPMTVEFWQGRPNRLHDRLQYVREGDVGWRVERLSP